MAGGKTPQIKYPYLPPGRTILYVPEKNPFMEMAHSVLTEQATDWNHPTGAVVVLGGEVVGRAADKSKLKNKKLLMLHRRGFCIRKVLKTPSGKRYWLCPGCCAQDHHAEVLAVQNAVENRGAIQGADLYLYGHWWCCDVCWNAMDKAGIANVYLLEGSERLFDRSNPDNIIGKQFEL